MIGMALDGPEGREGRWRAGKVGMRQTARRRCLLNASSPPSKAVRFRAAVVRPDRRCARRFEEVIKSLRNCRDFEQSGREVYA
jgi:hypothetical protein